MDSTTIIAEPPVQAAEPAWDEAYLRVQSYLRAYGMDSIVTLNEVTSSVIRDARERAASGAGGEPVALALEVTHSRIGAWFAKSGGECDWSDDQTRLQGRLALILADLPGRYANCFLGSDPMPPGLARAMSSFQILPGPEVRLSNMAPEPLEFAFLEPGDPRLRGRRFWRPARAIVSWILIFGFFGIAWAASH
ncbi:MAG TPA: hypothetical protein VGG37_00660 [Opitutaceae bacterium]|jgi:hypothetical protein